MEKSESTSKTSDKNKSFLIEIPKNSRIKYEVDKEGRYKYDRTLALEMAENYGCIFNSKIQEDGDFIDGFIFMHQTLERGTSFDLEDLTPIGLIKFIDGNDLDQKILYVPKCAYSNLDLVQGNVIKYSPKDSQENIEHYLYLRHLLTSVISFLNAYKITSVTKFCDRNVYVQQIYLDKAFFARPLQDTSWVSGHIPSSVKTTFISQEELLEKVEPLI